MTNDEFVAAASVTHGDKYGYSDVVVANRRSKVWILCKTHNEKFLQLAGNHLNGAGCPMCAAERRKSAAQGRRVGAEEFVRRAQETHGYRYDYSRVVYRTKDSKVEIICRAHGPFMQTAASHYNGHGCPKCHNEARAELNRNDPCEQLERFRQKHPTLDFSRSTYRGMHELMSASCPIHGEFSRKGMHFAARGCPACGKAKRASGPRTTAHFSATNAVAVQRGKARWDNWLAGYQGNLDFSRASYTYRFSHVEVVCQEHGSFYAPPSNLMHGHGCPKCRPAAISRAKRKPTDKFFKEVLVVHGNTYDYSKSVYKGRASKMTIVCRKHGEFEQLAGAHLAGAGCVICGAGKSQHESALADWLESLGETVVRRDRTVLAPKELDIWLPERKLAVEFHGCYWHTEDRVGNSHRVKWELADKAEIGLIQVFEDEWTDKQDIVKSRILARLGKLPKLGARRCEVVDLSWAESRTFLDKTHLQGAGPYGAVCLGLKHNGEICAVATFGRSRTGSMVGGGEDWEVLRYAASAAIAGGFSKLFAEFRNRHAPSRVISYCDLRYGTGGLYKACGFVLDSISQPDYWWYPTKKSNVRIPRYRTQKHKLKTHPELKEFYKDELSEREICEAAGWKRIFGVGNQKWIFTP